MTHAGAAGAPAGCPGCPMTEVGREDAFSVNSDVERGPFPMSFSCRQAEGIWSVAAGAAQAAELADLLVATANEAVAVVSLWTNCYLDEDWNSLRPSLIAAELGVLWFSGYDDCYVLLETRDSTLPGAVLGRLLTLMAGSAVADLMGDPSVRVPEPGPWLPERLMAAAPHWMGALDTVTEELVTIRLAALPEPWRLDVPFPQRADLTVTLDVRHGTWRSATSISLHHHDSSVIAHRQSRR